MRRILPVLLVLLLTGLAAGHAGEEQFNDTRELIASGTPCSELTEEQRVQIGDYYMEQMHPGEMHELMDQHMGGEGSDSLRQAHLNMADRFYCNTASDSTDSWGRMPMMGGTAGHGMWGMGTWGWFSVLLGIGLLVLLILAIIYLVKRIQQMSPQQERADTEPDE